MFITLVSFIYKIYKQKIILFWYKPFGYSFDQILPNNCGNCKVTSDRNEVRKNIDILLKKK